MSDVGLETTRINYTPFRILPMHQWNSGSTETVTISPAGNCAPNLFTVFSSNDGVFDVYKDYRRLSDAFKCMQRLNAQALAKLRLQQDGAHLKRRYFANIKSREFLYDKMLFERVRVDDDLSKPEIACVLYFAVCCVNDAKFKDIYTEKRKRENCNLRHQLAALMMLAGFNLHEISRLLERDRKTVMNSLNRALALFDYDEPFRDQFHKICKTLKTIGLVEDFSLEDALNRKIIGG